MNRTGRCVGSLTGENTEGNLMSVELETLVGRRKLSRRSALRLAGASLAIAGTAGLGTRRVGAQSNAEIEIALLNSFADPASPAMELIDAFNAKGNGVTVTGTAYGASYQDLLQKVQANIAAKIGPTLANTGWKYARFADAALQIVDLAAVDQAKTDSLLAKYRPWVADIVRVDGKVVGLPFALSTPIIYFNRDLFTKAGLDPQVAPKTWDEAASFATALKAAGVEAPIIGGIDEWEAQSFIQNNGGFVLDAEGKAVFDSAEAIGGMAVWTGLHEAGHFAPLASDQVLPTFLGGNAGMLFTSVAALGNINANATFEVGTGVYPATGTNPKLMPSGGNFLGLYTQDAEKQQAAFAFHDFVSSTEGVTIWNKTGYLIATNDQIEHLPGQEVGYEQMETGLTTETIWPGARGLEALAVFNDWVAKIVNGTVDVESGMKDGNKAVADLLP
jgi:multiple sugar transport system substrate-binding protein